MTLAFIAQDKLSVSKTNMRWGKKPPDVSDILPTVRKRGVIQTLLVRPNCEDGHYEIVAGARRFHAARLVAAQTGEAEPLPCRILSEEDDAAAIEASMIENFARLDPDEVSQWESFTRLVKEGRSAEDIADTFGLPPLAVTRILALGNLLPRIRDLYRRDGLDRATVRHLTLASKSQQKAWLALYDDTEQYAPTGHQLKAWLFGGAAILAKHALFDIAQSGLVVITDLFGEDGYFADPDAFWAAQNAAIEARCAQYLEAGWSDVVVVPPSDHFSVWEYEKTPKRKGGRVYVDVRASGEVTFHEGYQTRKEARARERGETVESAKPARPEVTSTLNTYIDLHRHAAVRAVLTGHPGMALRMMVAHAVAGSELWIVRRELHMTRNDAVAESVETCLGETAFDERRRAVLALLDLDPERTSVVGASDVVTLFARLLELPDAAVMDVIAVVMGESLAAGSEAVAALGSELHVDMADWWEADDALFELTRDKAVLVELVGEVAGNMVASANAKEPGKTLKKIVRDHLDGADGRDKVTRWVPRWMRFPASAYTTRGGVGAVAAQARAERARAVPQIAADPEPLPQAA